MIVSCIVEGDSEVAGLPILLRRLTEHFDAGKYVDIPRPLRVKRDRFINRDEEFRRFVHMANFRAQESGRVLIILDADDDCPVAFAEAIRGRAEGIVGKGRVSVVICNREFEAWFVAVADLLDGERRISLNRPVPANPEAIRGAKEWLSEQMEGKYHEVTDHPALCALLPIDEVSVRSRSFRKLCAEWRGFLALQN